MRKGLPSWSKLWLNYPNEANIAKVIETIFAGKKNYNWIRNNIHNTCAIRLSRALNLAGDPVNKTPGLHVLLGNDSKWYAYRVSEMENYLEQTYGSPRISKESMNPKELREAVKDKAGIIIFKVKGWADATGHVDLWDAGIIRHKEYFHVSYKVLLWTKVGGVSAAW